MRRAVGSMPWLMAITAMAIVGCAIVGRLPDPGWRISVLLAGLFAAAIGWRVNRLPLLFAGAMTVAAARLSGLDTEPVTSPMIVIGWQQALADFVVGIGLAAMVGVAVGRRHGRVRFRDLLDMLTVVIGASLMAWLLVARPLIEQFDVSPSLSVLFAAYLPVAAMLVAFTIDLLFTGLTRNRTMQFVTAAALGNLVAALIGKLLIVDEFAPRAQLLSVATYAGAFLMMCAGLAHRDAPATLERLADRGRRRADTPARFAVMAVSVLVPLALIASVSPMSNNDIAIRTIGTVGLMLAVVARLRIAMRDFSRAQLTLLMKLNRDELTGLPTRNRFVECVSEQLEATWRSQHRPTIIQLNLDRFKNINDSLGHYDANRVLTLVSGRLEEAARPFGGVVARVGGDDFAILDHTTTCGDDAMARAETIREALAAPVTVGDSTVFVTASIGAATAPRHRSISAEELLRRADIATHRAKADGRNRVAEFDDSMQDHLAQRMDVEHALHGAIGRKEMRLHHQPIIDLETGSINGFEALIRWQRNESSLVPPGDFIPIAEETGIICELGAWALEQALVELRNWIEDGLVPPTATMSVNVSPRQIADPGFADIVRHALEVSGVGPELLWLEMTESMMLEEPELARTTLQQVNDMGVSLALDDFGTGFSSLSLLQKFPIQRIKIDRAFVQGIADVEHDRSLVRTVIAMAHSMDLDVVAEGVETVHQLEELQTLGCAKAQGFLISRPVPPEAMRSTMVALDELATLSVFQPGHEVTLAGAVDQPAPATVAATVGVPLASGPIGTIASRPLGQPSL